MADEKKNPLIGAFRAPVPEVSPLKLPAIGLGKPTEEKKPTEPTKTPATGPAKPTEEKKPAEPPKAPAAGPANPTAGKKPTELPKAPTIGSAKPTEGKNPVEPSEAPVAAPTKPTEEKKPSEPPKAPTEDQTKTDDEEIPKDFKLPITKEGQSEIITTLKVSEIHPFQGHPFNVKDDQDMKDLVDSVQKFGVLEPVVVIPRKEGGYEMVSGHRRRRACELAGIATMPVIVRNLD